MKAVWNNEVIAESKETVVVEGNHYFPPKSLKSDYFQASVTTSFCPWKGTANYYLLSVNGKHNPDAAWYYPEPKAAAQNIKNYVAFWKGVEVSE